MLGRPQNSAILERMPPRPMSRDRGFKFVTRPVHPVLKLVQCRKPTIIIWSFPDYRNARAIFPHLDALREESSDRTIIGLLPTKCPLPEFPVIKPLSSRDELATSLSFEARKSVVSGKSVSVRVDLGGRRL